MNEHREELYRAYLKRRAEVYEESESMLEEIEEIDCEDTFVEKCTELEIQVLEEISKTQRVNIEDLAELVLKRCEQDLGAYQLIINENDFMYEKIKTQKELNKLPRRGLMQTIITKQGFVVDMMLSGIRTQEIAANKILGNDDYKMKPLEMNYIFVNREESDEDIITKTIQNGVVFKKVVRTRYWPDYNAIMALADNLELQFRP